MSNKDTGSVIMDDGLSADDRFLANACNVYCTEDDQTGSSGVKTPYETTQVDSDQTLSDERLAGTYMRQLKQRFYPTFARIYECF